LHDYFKEAQSNTGLISIEDQSKVSGQIIVLGKTQRDNHDAQIKVNANAIVEGTIYCEQNLELRGTVYGTVFTDNFIIKEGGSIFQNHLYNAIIDSGKLTSEFVGLHLDRAKKGIAKWLY
jgi:cytoskeletal protein CcmA (bactofilin family)